MSSKKAVKKPVKKPAAKKAVKKPLAKKPVKKAATKKVVSVKPITDSTGVVIMKSVDSVEEEAETKSAKVKAHLDKDTGVLTMVYEDEE
jgi:hypothetical protein